MLNIFLYIKFIISVVKHALPMLISSVIEAYIHTDVYKLSSKNVISITAISIATYLYAVVKYCAGISSKSNLNANAKYEAISINIISKIIKIIILDFFLLNKSLTLSILLHHFLQF